MLCYVMLCYDVSKLAGEAEAGPMRDLSVIGCVARVAACRAHPRAWVVAAGHGGVAGTDPCAGEARAGALGACVRGTFQTCHSAGNR